MKNMRCDLLAVRDSISFPYYLSKSNYFCVLDELRLLNCNILGTYTVMLSNSVGGNEV